jgi:DNA end-binding protein Ku
MARPMWSGTISLGLVTVPVALYAATKDHSVAFRQIERGTTDRIRLQRVNERTGKEVEYADVAKGYRTDDDVVEVEPEELADIAPGRSRSLEIDTFVDLADIDPTYFDRTYWLAPKDDDYAHAYHLLLRAMADTGLAGVAMLVMRGRQHLTAVRAGDGILVLHTMRFADEIRDPAKEIPDLPSAPRPKRRELDMATELIESMSGPWRPAEYRDDYEDRVRALVRDKEKGRKHKAAAGPAEPTKVIDLTDALRRSMRKADTRTADKRTAGRPATGTRPQGKRSRRRNSADPATMSKTELDALARELGVRGRSSMTKQQLATAVAGSRSKAS